MATLRMLGLMLAFVLATGSARAHFVWVALETGDGSNPEVQVYFGESAQPDAAKYLDMVTRLELETDSRGVASLKAPLPGAYQIRARQIVKESGEFDGRKYDEAQHYSTLTFAVAEAGAGKLSGGESLPSTQDRQYPDLPRGITSFGAAVIGDWLYVYGGHFGRPHHYSNTSQSDQLSRLNLSKDSTWEVIATGPRLQGLAMVAHGGKLYRLGGFTAHNQEDDDHDLRSVADFARFHPESGRWESLPSLPEPRSSHDAVVIGDKLYLAGGWRLGGEDPEWHQTAWVTDLSQEKIVWESLSEPPFLRRAVSLGHRNGKLYVIGGMQQEGGPTTRVDVYDPASGQWSQAPSLIDPKADADRGKGMEGFGSSAFTVGGRLFVSTYGGNVQVLDGNNDAWHISAKLEDDRFFHRMLPFNGRLLLVGGASMRAGKRLHFETVELSSLK